MTKPLFFTLLLTLAFSANAKEVIQYDWLTMGKKSGEHIVTIKDDKSIEATFEFNDRGRGPKVKELLTFDPKGDITSQRISGNSYMGAKIDEVYRVTNKEFVWKNTQESGSRKIKANQFYIAADGTPFNLELIIKAIDRTDSGRLELLPSGTASYDTLLSTEVSKGSEKQIVKLLALNGMGFGPSFLWVSEGNKLFALAYGWMGLTPQGWGENLEKLQALQDKAEFDYNKKLAAKNSELLKGITLIQNVNIYTATESSLIKESQIAIKNGKILAIGAKAVGIKADKVIDGKGRTLMPGLWDMHAHIQMGDGLLNIANGVTSVRDLANDHEQLMKTTEVFQSGEVIGPSIYRGGFIDQKSPFSAPTGKLAESLEDALKFIDWYAERGYQQIKIYSSITPDWVKPIAERVHQHGMRLSGHIPSYMTAEKAVKDGFDEIQHINMVFLNFLAGPKDDTRTPVRFKLVAEKAGSLNLDSKAVNDFIALLKQKGTVVDPTVTIFHSMFLNKAGELDPGYAMIADHLPANVARGFLAAEMDINADNEKQYSDSAEALLKMIKKLYDAGIPLVAGTDAIVGFTLHREMELYAKAGIPNDAVLKIVTVNSARIAGQKNVGTIEVGMNADLILLEGNPLQDISAVRKVAMTIKGDKAYRSEQLFNAIGIKPFVIY